MKVALKPNQPCAVAVEAVPRALAAPGAVLGPSCCSLTRGSRTRHRGCDERSLNRNGVEAGASCSDQPGSGATCLQHITPWPCWGVGPVAATQKASISLLSFLLWDTVWGHLEPVSLGSSLGCADARGSGGDILWEQWQSHPPRACAHCPGQSWAPWVGRIQR